MKLKELFKNFSYTILSNFISLAISTLVVLIVPKFIGVTEYGFWQLYIFYTTYVGVLHFGWLDGIYLRYGGYRYEDLDKPLFHSQFVQFCMMQAVLAVIISGYGILFGGPNRGFILAMTAVAMVLINLRQFSLYVLQDTNRIQEYAIINTIGRVVYFLVVLILLFLRVQRFEFFILADIIGRTCSAIYSFYACRDIIFRKFSEFFWSWGETWQNFSVGVKLLIANFAGSLIIGVVRYGVQMFWNVRTFGKISLTLNISNLLMTFISAVGLVLYPTLRRMNKDKLKNVYLGIREVLNSVLFLGLFLYYPINIILPAWLPKYSDSLAYMAILFPMAVYSGKFSLLIVTFMKTFRFEKDLLRVNIVSVVVSLITTGIAAALIHQIVVLMFSIILILWFQSAYGEFILGKKLRIRTVQKIIPETFVVLAFMLGNWFVGAAIGFLIYVAAVIVYLVYNKNSLKSGIGQLRQSLAK